MKLLQQTQRKFLRIVLPVFTITGVFMYLAMHQFIRYETDEKLTDTRAALEIFAQTHDTLPAFFQRFDERLIAVPMPDDATNFQTHFSDTTLLNPLENEMEPFRALHFTMKLRGQWTQVSLLQGIVEEEEMAWLIIALLLISFGVLFGAMVWVNRTVASQVWMPFYDMLTKMRSFRLNDQEPLRLIPTDVKEFQELQTTLKTLTDQAQKDFQTVKKFTENASHELQTPLAIIQNKVEMLLQNDALSETQAHQLNIVGQSTRRMARLNQSLLLLSKIENKQFSAREPIELKPLIEKKMAWLEDFIAEKQLVVQTTLHDKTLEINPFLAETLITNLLTNAVKHNLTSGSLHILLNEKMLVITNAAAAPNLSTTELTARFARGTHQSEGLGLGLSIALEICTQEELDLYLTFDKNLWTTQIEFPNKR